MSAPEGMAVGQRWRATCGESVLVGEVTYVSPVECGTISLRLDGCFQSIEFPADWSWERLPDPEPDWQPGDVVQDADGDVFVHTGCGWRYADALRADHFLSRPLVRLVPEQS